MSALLGDRAVVAGASMAGLLSARVLSDRFREVVVVERDRLPTGPRPRRGVPQDRHVHGLLARGRDVLEELLPGFTDEVVRHGGVTGDLAGDCRWHMNGAFLASYDSGMVGLAASRPLLESVVRSRVRALPNVRFAENTDVLGLTAAKGRVTGVRLRGRSGSDEEALAADLVVGATGRGAAAVGWLTELGYAGPVEDTVGVDLSYVTRHYRRRPGDLGGAIVLVVAAQPPDLRSAAVIAQEDDRWVVTLIGYLGEQAPGDVAGFTAYAAALPVPDVAELVSRAEPLDEPAVARFPGSRRRRWERAGALPERYVVVGDAISSFNPAYGQGMSVAAEESVVLAEALAGGLDQLPRRFFTATAKIVDVPWSLAATSDLRYPAVTGHRGPEVRLLNAYIGRLQVAARSDQVLAQAFFRVMNLLDSPQGLLRPALAARVLTGGPRPAWLPRLPRQRGDRTGAPHGPGGLPADIRGREAPDGTDGR